MRSYNVLWIDDQWDTQEAFLTLCEQEGIDIKPFKTSKEGMIEFEKHLYEWDGVILDAKVFDETEDEAPSTIGLTKSIYKIKELLPKRYVPWFVFTGQPDLQSNDDFRNMLGGENYYRKSVDLEQLLIDIKSEADKLPETRIRKKYSNIFEIFDSAELLSILIGLDGNDVRNSSYFNQMRKILEDIFSKLGQDGLFPSDCIKLNQQRSFLCSWKMAKYVPVYIQQSIYSLVEVSQDGSHRLKTDDDVKSGNAPYLLQSSTMELLNIILWFKDIQKICSDDSDAMLYIKSLHAPVIEEVNDLLIQTEEEKHIVERDASGNYHSGKYLISYKSGPDCLGKKIQILKSEPNSQSSKNLYPHFGMKYIIIDD